MLCITSCRDGIHGNMDIYTLYAMLCNLYLIHTKSVLATFCVKGGKSDVRN